ncbi:MAG: AzlD domain-containing protein [Deltaproteobacteria bacterium]|nr:MAG: AzlD domain-containing protein [Deltaproteobacteria bacterium]
MKIDSLALITICGMALMTYITRAGGFWIVSRLSLGKRMEAWLNHIPGAVLTAIVAPALSAGGLAEVVAALATGAVAVRSGNILIAMLVGIVVVCGLRILSL